MALRRSRIDLSEGQIEVRESLSDAYGQLLFGPTKTHQRRTVVLPPFLVEVLADHLARYVGAEPSALVFTSSSGAVLRDQGFTRRAWRPAVTRAGSEGLADHRSWHVCVSAPIASGASATEIMKQVGHEGTQKTTYGTYGHPFPARGEGLERHLDDIGGAKPEDRVGLPWGWRRTAVTRLPAQASGNRL